MVGVRTNATNEARARDRTATSTGLPTSTLVVATRRPAITTPTAAARETAKKVDERDTRPGWDSVKAAIAHGTSPAVILSLPEVTDRAGACTRPVGGYRLTMVLAPSKSKS